VARAPARWRVYLLRCVDGSLYAGATNDLDRRLAAHAAGRGARYTRSRLPVALAYQEPARDRSAALRREAALKRLTRAAKLLLVAEAPASLAPGTRRRPRPKADRNRSLAHMEHIDTHKGRPRIMRGR
jgi:putative endonuclease